MDRLDQFCDRLIARGRVEPPDVTHLRSLLGPVDQAQADLLVGLHARVGLICDEFEQLVFDQVRDFLVTDGTIAPDAGQWLRQVILVDGRITAREKKLVRVLKQELIRSSDDFEALYLACMR